MFLPTYLESFRSLFGLVFVQLGADGAIENTMSLVFTSSMMLLVQMLLPLALVPFAVSIGALIPGGCCRSCRRRRIAAARCHRSKTNRLAFLCWLLHRETEGQGHPEERQRWRPRRCA
jgi:hypothetical protein